VIAINETGKDLFTVNKPEVDMEIIMEDCPEILNEVVRKE